MQLREVDFLLRSLSQEKAELVADFINDFQFGTANNFFKSLPQSCAFNQ